MTSLRRARPLLGTLVDIHLEGWFEPAVLHDRIEKAFGVVRRVHTLMSVHEPNSELDRLNRQAHYGPIPVHPWTWEVLRVARQMCVETEGAFDPAVGATLATWGYRPPRRQRDRPEREGSMRDVEVRPDRSIHFRRPLYLDLGGIAKGFAVDRAVEALAELPGLRGVVDAGGDLRVFGAIQRTIAVRHPSQPGHVAAVVHVKHGALATSANTFARRWWRCRRVAHLVDAIHRKRPSPGDRSVSVSASTCMVADALTKAGFGPDRSAFKQLLARYDAQGLVVRRDGFVDLV